MRDIKIIVLTFRRSEAQAERRKIRALPIVEFLVYLSIKSESMSQSYYFVLVANDIT